MSADGPHSPNPSPKNGRGAGGEGRSSLLLGLCALLLISILFVPLLLRREKAAEAARNAARKQAEAARVRGLEDRAIFHPEDAANREALAEAYQECGDPGMAAALRTRGKEGRDPDAAVPPDLRELVARAAREPESRTLQQAVVTRAQEASRLSAAIPALRRLVRLEPADAGGWRRLGVAELQAGEGRAARDHLRAAVARAPRDAVAQFYLGLAHAGRAEVPAALAAFARVQALQPDYAPAALERVRLLIEEWRLAEAAAAAERLIRRRPRLADAHYHLGVARYHLRDYPSAEAALRTATRLDPRRARYPGWLGLVLLEQGRSAEAIVAFEVAIAANPRYPNALYQLGRAYLAAGRLEDAEPHLRRALLLDPRHAEAFYSFSQMLLRQARHAEAKQALARVRALNRFDQQRQALEQRALSEPRRSELRRRLGDLYAREGLAREAAAQYERAEETTGQ